MNAGPQHRRCGEEVRSAAEHCTKVIAKHDRSVLICWSAAQADQDRSMQPAPPRLLGGDRLPCPAERRRRTRGVGTPAFLSPSGAEKTGRHERSGVAPSGAVNGGPAEQSGALQPGLAAEPAPPWPAPGGARTAGRGRNAMPQRSGGELYAEVSLDGSGGSGSPRAERLRDPRLVLRLRD